MAKLLKQKSRGRKLGDALPDRAVDFYERWWPLVSAAGFPSFFTWVKTQWADGTISWIDASIAGIFIGLIFTCLLLGILVLLRQIVPRSIAVSDRKDFSDEEITLAELVGDGAPLISHKTFKRCLIRGPGQLKLHLKVENLYCSLEERNICETAVGASIIGSVFAVNCTFIECHFDCAIICTPEDTTYLRTHFQFLTVADWKAKYVK